MEALIAGLVFVGLFFAWVVLPSILKKRHRPKTAAVFLERDGIINPTVYHPDFGHASAPFSEAQFSLLPGVAEAIRDLGKGGYKVIVVSNQSGIARGHLSTAAFEAIRRRMNGQLVEEGAGLDGDYYCHHGPGARCACRKPKPGLLLAAARECAVDLSESWMVGDSVTDIQAGKNAGCRTVMIGGRVDLAGAAELILNGKSS